MSVVLLVGDNKRKQNTKCSQFRNDNRSLVQIDSTSWSSLVKVGHIQLNLAELHMLFFFFACNRFQSAYPDHLQHMC